MNITLTVSIEDDGDDPMMFVAVRVPNGDPELARLVVATALRISLDDTTYAFTADDGSKWIYVDIHRGRVHA